MRARLADCDAVVSCGGKIDGLPSSAARAAGRGPGDEARYRLRRRSTERSRGGHGGARRRRVVKVRHLKWRRTCYGCCSSRWPDERAPFAFWKQGNRGISRSRARAAAFSQQAQWPLATGYSCGKALTTRRTSTRHSRAVARGDAGRGEQGHSREAAARETVPSTVHHEAKLVHRLSSTFLGKRASLQLRRRNKKADEDRGDRGPWRGALPTIDRGRRAANQRPWRRGPPAEPEDNITV